MLRDNGLLIKGQRLKGMIPMIQSEVINQAISYIMEHIGEDILIEEVAKHCHFSKFHFSRMFKEETGESLYAFIKRLKMEQSAFRLKLERNRSITDIGLDYGYTASNYSTAFKQYHHISPAKFRKSIYDQSIKHPFFKQVENVIESFEECNKKVTIEELDDQYVIYERRIGNYNDLARDWQVFNEKYKEYITEETVFMERTYDDPSITDTNMCLYDICMIVDKSCPLENTYIVQGGKFVVYHFKGYVGQIYAAYQSLFNEWFPKSHYVIDERYGFEIYRGIDCENMYMEMELCIPVK